MNNRKHDIYYAMLFICVNYYRNNRDVLSFNFVCSHVQNVFEYFKYINFCFVKTPKKVFHESIKEELLYESNRRIHKRTFYRDLYDDLMPVAWHPDRFLDWCIDIEELKCLKRAMGGPFVIVEDFCNMDRVTKV